MPDPRWHEQRRLGQAERFERMRRCGTTIAVQESYDPDTGALLGTRPLLYHCDQWRVCARCQARRKRRLAREVLTTRAEARRAHRRELGRYYRGAEGRWGERLITLTVPHSGDPGQDVQTLVRAWREFQRRLLAHLSTDRECEGRPVWVRALEVAPSDDGGHAHLHVWWIGPFLDHVWARVTWGRVLESMGIACPQRSWDDAMERLRDQRVRQWCRTRRGPHGRQPDTLPWPHVHLSLVRGDESGAAEYATKVGVAHYVAKGSDTLRMDARHAASVYQALEGARAVQWARGWAPARRRSPLVHRLRPLTHAERVELGMAGDETVSSRVSSADAPKDGGDACAATDAGVTAPRAGPDVQTTCETTLQLSLL